MDQRGLDAGTRDHPAREGDERNHQHHRHEHGRHLVDHALDRRLRGLGVLDQPDDACQHALGADRAHLDHHAAVAVHGAAGQRVTGVLGHRQRFAREHRFVDFGLPFEHARIGRHAFAGTHGEPVADHHLGQRHVAFLAACVDQVRHFGPQLLQRADRRGGLALGARLEPLAQQHQRDHHRRGFEVQVRHHAVPRMLAGGGAPPQPQRQAEGRAGAQRHQQVHVAGAGLGRMPARAVETRAEPELHRRREQQLHPGRQHPALADQVAEHRRHQRDRQRQADGHGHEAVPGRQRGGLVLRGAFGARFVAGGAHGAAQQQGHVLAAGGHDAGRLGREVDAHVLHAGHVLERALHAHHARGAGHAADREVQRGGGRGRLRLNVFHGPEAKA
ncbi:hypothetical protein D3C71_1162190 [compost metagenome]